MSQSDETVHIMHLIDVIFSRHIAEGEVHKKKRSHCLIFLLTTQPYKPYNAMIPVSIQVCKTCTAKLFLGMCRSYTGHGFPMLTFVTYFIGNQLKNSVFP